MSSIVLRRGGGLEELFKTCNIINCSTSTVRALVCYCGWSKLNLTAALNIVSFLGIWDPPSRYPGNPSVETGEEGALKKKDGEREEGKKEGIELN